MRKLNMSVLSLVLGCLFILSFCKSPVSPDIPDTPENNLPVVHFSAKPYEIHRGEFSILSWTVLDAAEACLDDGQTVDSVELIGSREVCPLETTTYTLAASNVYGTVDKKVQIQVWSPLGAWVELDGFWFEFTCPATPAMGDGEVMMYRGEVRNASSRYATNIVIHLLLLDSLNNELCHLTKLFIHPYYSSSCLGPGMSYSPDAYVWTVSWNVCSQVDEDLSEKSVYVTWDTEDCF